MCDGTDLANRRESTIVVVEIGVAINAGTKPLDTGEDVSLKVLVLENRLKLSALVWSKQLPVLPLERVILGRARNRRIGDN